MDAIDVTEVERNALVVALVVGLALVSLTPTAAAEVNVYQGCSVGASGDVQPGGRAEAAATGEASCVVEDCQAHQHAIVEGTYVEGHGGASCGSMPRVYFYVRDPV